MKGFPPVKSVLITVVAFLALAPAAAAQVPTNPSPPPPQSPPPPPPPQPQPVAADAKLVVRIDGGISEHGRKYALRGDKLVVRGRIKPFVAGQKVLIEMFRHGKRVRRAVARVHKAAGAGEFRVAFTLHRLGGLGVRARHKANAKQKAGKSAKLHFTSLVPRASRGSRGASVRLMQDALARLAYVTSRGGYYDDATARALLAYRKVNGMARITSANRTIFRRLFAGRGTYHLRYPNAGKHVEFDWSRQVLVLARGGAAERIYHASSGKPSTPTVFGTFHFYRKQPGTNAHGMVDSNYFIRGYAIHGYVSVPTYAASHGCIRVPIPVAASIYNWISLGDPIYVYR
jgi:hypothetical protein